VHSINDQRRGAACHGKEAIAKYDEPLKYAPNWKHLKEVRETVVRQ